MPTEDTDIVFFQWLRKKLEPQWHLHIQYKFGRVPHLLNRGSEVHHLFNGPDMICKSFCYGWSSPQPLSFALGDLQLYRIVWLVPDQRSGTASAELKHDEVVPCLEEVDCTRMHHNRLTTVRTFANEPGQGVSDCEVNPLYIGGAYLTFRVGTKRL